MCTLQELLTWRSSQTSVGSLGTQDFQLVSEVRVDLWGGVLNALESDTCSGQVHIRIELNCGTPRWCWQTGRIGLLVLEKTHTVRCQKKDITRCSQTDLSQPCQFVLLTCFSNPPICLFHPATTLLQPPSSLSPHPLSALLTCSLRCPFTWRLFAKCKSDHVIPCLKLFQDFTWLLE